MLCANLVNVFLNSVPNVLAHNQGDTLRAFDLPAPLFQFLLGVSLVLFLDKHAARSGSVARAQFAAVQRFALLIGLGCLLDAIGTLDPTPRWGVLQTLGLGGIVATLMSPLRDETVGLVALSLVALFSGVANGDVHHSPFAAFAFVPLTLGGLLVGRGLRPGSEPGHFVRRAAAVAAIAIALVALERIEGVPYNKVIGSGSFVALTTALAALVLLAMERLERAGTHFPRWLLTVGGNALTAWVLQYVLVYYPAWFLFPSWDRLAFVPGLASVAIVTAMLASLTVALGRRGLRIPI